MPNYFSDNADLQFHLSQLDLRESVAIAENGYNNHEQYPHAPLDYEDAMHNYRLLLNLIGNIAGNSIAQRVAQVDEEGAIFSEGKVTYAVGTSKNLEELTKADLMGMILPY